MRYAVLFGSPNSGKTTLFNQLTGLSNKIINYPGSTVDIAIGHLLGHSSVTIIDAPGIQSFVPNTEDERLSLKSIVSLSSLIKDAPLVPDLVICVLDATQRSRHLAMIKRLIDDGYPVVVVITMVDQAKKQGVSIDHKKLSQALGVTVFQINARKKDGIEYIKNGIALNSVPCGRLIQQKPFQLDDISNAYDWAEAVMQDVEIITPVKPEYDIDRVLLHPVFGYVAFFGIMSLFFYLIFFLSIPLMDSIDYFFSWASEQVLSFDKVSWGTEFLANGLMTGIGAILVFVPQIALLFFVMGIFESTGYLSRSAALIDKPLSKIGLNGRSFLPLLSGCACAIPAILATRTIPNKKVRLLTIFIIPLMQCSARLPVFGLLLGMLFSSPWSSALALTGIYFFSIVLSAILAIIAGYFIPNTDNNTYFMIELPAWRWPVWKTLFFQVMHQTKSFIKGAGPIILIITVVLWFLSSVPSSDKSVLLILGQYIDPIFKPMGVDWRIGIAIILSFAAREVFVSALAVVLNLSDAQLTSVLDITQLTHINSEQLLFTTGSIFGLIVFFMIAMQCGATVAIVKKETGSYKFAIIQLVLFIVLAYGLAVFFNWLF